MLLMQLREWWVPVLRALNGEFGIIFVSALPQTVIKNMLLHSQYPSFLLCNLLKLQGVKNVCNSVFVPWVLY